MAAPGQAAKSLMDGSTQMAAPGQAAQSLLDGTTQAGAPGQSMMHEAGAAGAPGQSMKHEAGAPGAPGQSMKHDAGASGAPGQSMKSDAGGPGQPGQSMVEAGTAGGPGQPPAAKDASPGASGGPEDAKSQPAAEESASGGPGAANGASGGPGGPGANASEDEELVDPDADRPNFGSGEHDEEESEDETEDDDAFAGVAARAGAKGGRAAKKKSKPINPAYVSVAVMGLAVLSLVGMIWLGRGIMLQVWPGISGFYKSMGVEAARPGEGLKIAESSRRLQRIGGVETLVVRGFISNISEVPKTVPNLRLELYNEKKEVIQDAATKAPVGLLDPNGSVEYEIRMVLPQLNLAKGGYGVVWEQ